ncbi:MAG: glycosyltransferase family 2 protein [Tepidisphaeraceae bacterium]
MPRISTVTPLYQTAQYLRELHRRLTETLSKLEGGYELVMVDDGSRDGAWEILSDIARTDPHVKAIKLSRNFGQHPAIAAGLEHATGDQIILMDADLQDRPEDIPLLLENLKGDVDVVYTVKTGPHDTSTTHSLTSRMYHYVFSKLTHTNVPRDIGTLRAFSRRFLDAVLEYPERSVLFGPLMFHVGFVYTVVQVQRDARQGKSSYSFRRRLALALNSLLSYTDLPHRILVNTGAIILAGSVLYLIAILARWVISRDKVPPGLTLTVLLITITLGATMFGLGIIGTYVFRVYQEVLARPRYIISRSINLK